MFDPCLFPITHVNKALQMDPHDSRVVTTIDQKFGVKKKKVFYAQ